MSEPYGGFGDEVVLEVLDRLAEPGITVWIDGGWGIDALIGAQTRTHRDLDLVIAEDECAPARAALEELGYAHDPSAEPGLPARLVLRDREGHEVDFHVVVMDERGNGWQPLGEGAWGGYPAAGLRGVGTIAGRQVGCLTPELQLRHHLGYPPAESDRHDLRLLAERYGLSLPPGL